MKGYHIVPLTSDGVQLLHVYRVMEAAVWGCARWADTYLMPEEAASPGLADAFGRQGGGPAVLDVLMQIANACLSQ